MAGGNPSPLFRSGYSGNVYRHKRSPWRALRPLISVVLVLAIVVGAFYTVYLLGRHHPLVHSATGLATSSAAGVVTITAGDATYTLAQNVAWFPAGSKTARQGTRASCLVDAASTRVTFGWLKIANLSERVVVWVRC